MKTLALVLFLAFASPLLVVGPGCQTAPSARVVEVQTLKVLGASAKATVDASALLLKQGRLTVPQWQKIAEFYDLRFQPAYNLATVAVRSDLSTVASPDLIALAGQLSALVASFTSPTP